MESELPVIDISPCRLDAMMELYADLVQKLEEPVLKSEFTEFSYLEIRDMTNRVIQNLAKNYGNVRERICGIMGGKVLETELSRAKHERREEEAVAVVKNMLHKGKTPEEIADFCNYALSDIKIVQEHMLQKQTV